MGDLQILMDENGLKFFSSSSGPVPTQTSAGILCCIANNYFRRQRLDGIKRRLVVNKPNYSGVKQRVPDDSSTLLLKGLFLVCLCLALTKIVFDLFTTSKIPLTVSPGSPALTVETDQWKGMVFLAVFTAVFVFAVGLLLLLKRITPSSQDRRLEVKTISGPIQDL